MIPPLLPPQRQQSLNLDGDLLALFLGLLAPGRAQQSPTSIRLLPEDAERGLNGPQHNFDFLAPGSKDDNYQTAIGVFVGSLLASVFINRDTNSHLQRAVKSFNTDFAHGSVWPRLRPAALGLAAAPTGQPLLAMRWTLR